MPFYAQHIKSARLHLQKNDPVMKQVLKKVGPFTAKVDPDRFGVLVESIISQQISAASAGEIRERLRGAVEPDGITPTAILQFSLNELLEIGVPHQKASVILNLVKGVSEGSLDLGQIHRQEDEAVIEQMTQIIGLDRGAVQMFLMFSLGRQDILPNDDMRLKNAVKQNYGLAELPDSQKIVEVAEKWRPYATVASWYLWQSLLV
ncbi:MAG: hypothetical protein P8J27_08605 [Mariniblastus sp.]|nr:hypothetical protein [Mariniblastus sp.]